MHAHDCWSCGHPDADSLFCRYCNSLQSPTPDYYEFFHLPHNLSLDPGLLQRQFYTLSRLLHPDRYTRRTDQEKQYSLEATAILNDGYRTLRDPIRRAEYVLREAGFKVGEQTNKDVPPELLEEVFELNLALDELRHGDDEVLPQLEESRRRFLDRLKHIDGELLTAFREHDVRKSSESRRESLLDIRAVLNRRRYIQNLLSEVDKQLVARNA